MLDASNWQKGPPFDCETVEDSELLNQMAEQAERYVSSFRWAPDIEQLFFAGGVPGVMALFLLRFKTCIPEQLDRELWVIVGDLPSAYFVTDNADDPPEAIEVYCGLMDDWIDAVRTNSDLNAVFPVEAAATFRNADDLESRLRFIREQIAPVL